MGALSRGAMTYREWCQVRRVTHMHCPLGCEHPQPEVLADGRLVCGRCLAKYRTITECIQCDEDSGCTEGAEWLYNFYVSFGGGEPYSYSGGGYGAVGEAAGGIGRATADGTSASTTQE